MKKALYWTAALLLASACGNRHADLVANAPSLTVQLTDDLGQTFEFRQPPQRIIVLTPGQAETLLMVGAKAQIVGVTEAGSYLGDLGQTPKLAVYPALDFQTLVSLKPDLVVLTDEVFNENFREALKRVNIPFYYQRVRKLSDVYTGIRQLGVLTGHEERGNQLADSLMALEAKLRALTEKQAKYGVAVIFGGDQLQSIGRGHYLTEMIAIAGGRNVLEGDTAKYVAVQPERLVQLQTEFVLIPTLDDKYGQQLLGRHEVLLDMPAVEQEHLFQVEPALYMQPGPRVGKAMLELTRMLHSQVSLEGLEAPVETGK